MLLLGKSRLGEISQLAFGQIGISIKREVAPLPDVETRVVGKQLPNFRLGFLRSVEANVVDCKQSRYECPLFSVS